MTNSLSADFPLQRVCRVFDVPRSSLYQVRLARTTADPERARLHAKVIALHTAGRHAAGSRTLSAQLKAQGEPVGRFKAGRLMKECALESVQPPKREYRKAERVSHIADNLVDRQFTVEAPNQVWCTDVTQILVAGQWLYLAVVLDLYGRRAVGWALSDSPDSALTCRAVRMAFEHRNRPTGTLIHSDQGCHFTSQAYQRCVQALGIRHSMSRRGNCWDNAPMERFFRSMKTEWIQKKLYRDRPYAVADITEYVGHFYNHRRPHSVNDYLTPAAFELTNAA